MTTDDDSLLLLLEDEAEELSLPLSLSSFDHELYSEFQKSILSYLPIFVAPLSLLGSLTIVYVILYDRNTTIGSLERLVLGMSSMDLLSSIAMIVLFPWSIPKEQAGMYVSGAKVTNEFTICEIGGFLVNGMFGSMWYSLFMAFYFVLITRYHWTSRSYTKYIEPIGHLFAIGSVFGIGSIAIYDDWFSPLYTLPGWCWFMSYPVGCRIFIDNDEEVEEENNINKNCSRGGGQWEVPMRYFFELFVGRLGVPLVWLGIILSMILLLLHVRHIEQRLQTYSITYNNNTNNSNTNTNSNNTNNTNNSNHLIRTKKTAIQALLYIGAFFLVFIWGFIITGVLSPAPLSTSSNRTLYFTLACLTKLFQPLQGFFNAIVFLRNKYKPLLQDGECLAFIGNIMNHHRRSFFSSSIMVSNNSSNVSSSMTQQQVQQVQNRPQRSSSFLQRITTIATRRTPVATTAGSANTAAPPVPVPVPEGDGDGDGDGDAIPIPIPIDETDDGTQNTNNTVDPRERFTTDEARQRRERSLREIRNLEEEDRSTSFFGWAQQ